MPVAVAIQNLTMRSLLVNGEWRLALASSGYELMRQKQRSRGRYAMAPCPLAWSADGRQHRRISKRKA